MAVLLSEPLATPTEEGCRRYSATAGFYQREPSDAEDYPCTCAPACANPCDGICDCVACKTRSLDHQEPKSSPIGV